MTAERQRRRCTRERGAGLWHDLAIGHRPAGVAGAGFVRATASTARWGKFLAREYEENIEAWTRAVEPKLHLGRESVALSASVLRQLTLAAIALIAGLRLYRMCAAMPALARACPQWARWR